MRDDLGVVNRREHGGQEDDPGSRGDDAPGMPEDRDQQDDVGQ